MNKLDRWLNGMTEETLKQTLRFILEPEEIKESMDSIGFVKLQIEEFSRMFQEFKKT